MTAKLKAIELIHKFCSTTEGLYKSKKNIKNAKQCALIAVDEILSIIWINLDDEVDYWAEVKQEIEKL